MSLSPLSPKISRDGCAICRTLLLHIKLLQLNLTTGFDKFLSVLVAARRPVLLQLKLYSNAIKWRFLFYLPFYSGTCRCDWGASRVHNTINPFSQCEIESFAQSVLLLRVPNVYNCTEWIHSRSLSCMETNMRFAADETALNLWGKWFPSHRK